MKRAFSLLLALCLILSLLPFGAAAADIVSSGTCGENLTWTLDVNGLLTISGFGDMTEAPWPRSSVKSIRFDGEITSACSRAFSNCVELTEIVIPDSLSAISESMFRGCTRLTSVTIPDSVSNIRSDAFRDCSSLISVVIPEGVGGILFSAFSGCSSLETVIIPDSVVIIWGEAFSNCTSLKEISALGTVYINSDAFAGCTALQRAEVSGNINERAFFGCTELKAVVIHAGIYSNLTISSYAFGNCSALTEIWLPENLKTVEANAFRNDVNLIDVNFSASRETWNTISINATGNEPLLLADIHCDNALCSHSRKTLIKEKEATCSEPGYTGDVICQICGETLKKGEMIPVTGHMWNDWVTIIPATENESGLETHTCSVCGESETRDIPMLCPFDDVPASAYYHDSVLWAYTHEPQITSGYTDGTFRPDQVCTRAQVVTFLWRAAGEPEPKLKVNPFRDVSESAYYYKAVLWAVESGVTTGNSASTFNPDGECTRAQVVTFLWRAAGEPEPESMANPFSDVSNSAYYCKAVLWAREQGITTGNTATTFNPTGKCTRAHVVTFLYRASI